MPGRRTLVAINGRRGSGLVSSRNNIYGRILRAQTFSRPRAVVHVERHAGTRFVERALSRARSSGRDSVAAAAAIGEFGAAETRVERRPDGAEAAHTGP